MTLERDALHTIVVLEDGDEDFAVLQRVLHDLCPGYALDRVRDGDELMGRMSSDPEGLLARLALFDVNLPGLGGVEVLSHWRAHELLSTVPVVVLSGSARSNEVDECYRLGAAGYLAKPFGLPAYRRMVEALTGYWLGATTPAPVMGSPVADGAADPGGA